MNMRDELLIQKINSMTPQQATMYGTMAKKSSTAILMALFFGIWGGQYFYMGKTGKGIMCMLFFWTLIPAIASILFLFVGTRIVSGHNLNLINSILSSQPNKIFPEPKSRFTM